jgi:hypothetical protein
MKNERFNQDNNRNGGFNQQKMGLKQQGINTSRTTVREPTKHKRTCSTKRCEDKPTNME